MSWTLREKQDYGTAFLLWVLLNPLVKLIDGLSSWVVIRNKTDPHSSTLIKNNLIYPTDIVVVTTLLWCYYIKANEVLMGRSPDLITCENIQFLLPALTRALRKHAVVFIYKQFYDLPSKVPHSWNDIAEAKTLFTLIPLEGVIKSCHDWQTANCDGM